MLILILTCDTALLHGIYDFRECIWDARVKLTVKRIVSLQDFE